MNANAEKKLIREHVKTKVNENGRRLSEATSQTFLVPNEPTYVKVYIEDIIKLKCLPKGNSSVLYELIRYVDYQNEIHLNPRIKKRICERLGINPNSLNNALTKLIKSQVISRIDRGSFLLNPYLFAKGKWSDIRRLREQYLTLSIRYKGNGKKILSSKLESLTSSSS
jgi:hypothetical protein